MVSLELDSYEEDWTKLGGVLVHGRAEFIESGADHELGLALLRNKYPQYRTGPSSLNSSTPIVKVAPYKVASWYLGGNSVPRFGAY